MVEGDCPICRAGFKPKVPDTVLVNGRDLRTGKAFGINLTRAAWNKLTEIAREHEPLGTELCLVRREDLNR